MLRRIVTPGQLRAEERRSQPLATLGDAVNWRAELRANDIERRPPPSEARPDRGHIEQPGERIDKAPPQMLRPPPERETRLSPHPLPGFTAQRTTEETTREAPQSLVKIERGKADVPAKKPRKPRARSALYGMPPGEQDRFRLALIREVILDGRHGCQVRIAAENGISHSGLSNWVKAWRDEHGNVPPPDPDASQTLLSAPAPPPGSAVQSAVQSAAPAITPSPAPVTAIQAPPALGALESYINALVDQRVELAVERALKAQMRKIWGDQ